MILNAIIKIAHTFFDILTAYVVWRVFVATIAGILLVVVACMASHTAGIVVTIQTEILGVVKGRRCPFYAVEFLRKI